MKRLTVNQQRYIEGYAAALQDILFVLTGDTDCAKSYDPMTCESNVMHSYAFDMKDGGRHHEVSQYKSIEDIKKTLLEQVLYEIKCEQQLQNC
jgi:hypothetical protein